VGWGEAHSWFHEKRKSAVSVDSIIIVINMQHSKKGERHADKRGLMYMYVMEHDGNESS
jgi:hypothetical protein